MIKRFIAWMKGVFGKVRHIGDAKKAFHIDVAIGPRMQDEIDLWGLMFRGQAAWVDEKRTRSLSIQNAVSGELARLTTVEFVSEITGSARADYLQEQYRNVLKNLRRNVEQGLAGGGLAFKPYVDGGRIAVDVVPAWRFLPTSTNSMGEVTGAVFVETATKGDWFFTRMEAHQLTDDGYTIQNRAYMSKSKGDIGKPCALTDVDEWADLEPDVFIAYSDGTMLDKPLFAYFKNPQANNIEPESALGISCYAHAVNLIRDADTQYGYAMWEFEGGQLAVEVSDFALRKDEHGRVQLDKFGQRLYRGLSMEGADAGGLYQVFSPTLRDVSLFNGLDKILRRIEFNCNLAYGTLSQMDNGDKTAEEIRSSKQRSYSAVSDIQKSLQEALENLVWVLDIYASLYSLAPSGEYDLSFTWGDGVLEDAEAEFVRRKALVDAGLMKGEKFIAWYLGISEEEALEYIPEKSTMTSLFGE